MRRMDGSLAGWIVVATLAGCVGTVEGGAGEAAPSGTPDDPGAPRARSSGKGNSDTQVTAGNPSAPSGGGTGDIANPGPIACGAGDVGPRRVWRLTKAQYRNSLAVLFQGRPSAKKQAAALTFPIIDAFDSVNAVDRFSNYAASYSLDDLELRTVLDNADEVAGRLVTALRTDRASCLGSTPRPALRDCVRTLVADKGALLFRRPLAPDEIDYFTSLSVDAASKMTDDEAAATAFAALLVAPQFLFRSELGGGAPGTDGSVKLTDYEVASALALSLTDYPPDEELWQAAAAGGLSTPESIGVQVERLVGALGDQPTVLRFFREYVPYQNAATIFKDPKLYPFHNGELLVADTDLFVRQILSKAGRSGLLNALLTSSTGVARQATAASYGLPSGLAADPRPVTLPPTQRAGILTQPSLLTAFSDGERTHVVRRGRFVSESLLCRAVPELPNGQVPPLPDLGPNATGRDRLRMHSVEPRCVACHRFMDPLGLGFEAYDHVGRYRTTEGGKPVDASGVLSDAGMGDGAFDGVVDLAGRLAASPVVSACFVRHGFRYWMGRAEGAADGCALAAARDALAGSGDYLKMLTAFFQSRSFLRRANQP